MFLIAEPSFSSQLCELSDKIAFLSLGKLRRRSHPGKDFGSQWTVCGTTKILRFSPLQPQPPDDPVVLVGL